MFRSITQEITIGLQASLISVDPTPMWKYSIKHHYGVFNMLDVQPIKAFSDNYIWCLIDRVNQHAFVVDPGDAAPVKQYLAEHALTLKGILVTHYHPDHTGGLPELMEANSLTIYGPHTPAIEHIPNRMAQGDELVDQKVSEGDVVEILGHPFKVLETPGHTLDHIVFFSAELSILFSGDTLFYGGCGRVFEGTAEMMQHSLDKLSLLPNDTRIFCAHEYTQGNLHFAHHVETDNEALKRHIRDVESIREKGNPSVPSTIESEKLINPFLRTDQTTVIQSALNQGCRVNPSRTEVFAAIRGWKDHF